MMHRLDAKVRYARETASYDLWRGGIVLLIHTAKDYLQSAYSENLRFCATDHNALDARTPCDGSTADAGMLTNSDGANAGHKFAQCIDLLTKRIESATQAYPNADLHQKTLMDKVTTIKVIFNKEENMDIGAIKFHLNLLLFQLLTG